LSGKVSNKLNASILTLPGYKCPKPETLNSLFVAANWLHDNEVSVVIMSKVKTIVKAKKMTSQIV
jgi:hypothetical protein